LKNGSNSVFGLTAVTLPSLSILISSNRIWANLFLFSVNAGNCLDNIDRNIEALDYYEQALKYEPNHGMAIGNKGVGLFSYAQSVNTSYLSESKQYKNYYCFNSDIRDKARSLNILLNHPINFFSVFDFELHKLT
jgi:hypothetical protein